MVNLDMIAAMHAQAIITATLDNEKKSNVENVTTKALGVIQEQGIYAGMLYLLSRPEKEKKIATAICKNLVALLKTTDLDDFKLAEGLSAAPNAQDLLNHFATVVCAKPISTLLLVKNLFEQTLMYARYGAKARPDDKQSPQPTEFTDTTAEPTV